MASFQTTFWIRECCHTILVILNAVWIIFLWNKYHQSFNQYQFKISLSLCIVYNISTLAQSIYNGIYGFFHVDEDGCKILEIGEQSLVACNKILIIICYVFFCYEAEIIRELSHKHLQRLSVFLAMIFLGLAGIYIALQHVHIEQHDISGRIYVSCDNDWNNMGARTVAVILVVIESICEMVFISLLTFKLGQLTVKDGPSNNIHLYRKIVKTITLTVIQFSSSLIIIMIPQLIEGKTISVLRWIAPWNYIINSCCLCLMCAEIEPWTKLKCLCFKAYDANSFSTTVTADTLPSISYEYDHVPVKIQDNIINLFPYDSTVYVM